MVKYLQKMVWAIMKLKKIILLLNTIKYLKFKQLYYRLYYKLFSSKKLILAEHSFYNLKLEPSIPLCRTYKNREFSFLNISHKFNNKIEWNYKKYGKLWTYNLTYFDYLNQKDINKDEALELIYDFIENIGSIKDGLEPFPISLRGINWIKFLTYNNIEDKTIANSLYSQYRVLYKNIEYHLLGNHLLENGFSLLFGAYYFRDNIFYKRAKEILNKELSEQILSDGAHFELSPMYHQIMLFRLLDIINLVQNSSWQKDDEFLGFLECKASVMLGFLEQIIFSNGDFPLVNDSALNIAPTPKELFNYAKELNIPTSQKKIRASGYHMIKKGKYELFLDISEIKASYIPGHSHSDTFNFLLRVNSKDIVVDTGVSTYEANSTRDYERSSKAHNTVEIKGANQSEVWGAFRVANRAKIIKKLYSPNKVVVAHNGYLKRFKTIHQRAFEYEDNLIKITDILIGKIKEGKAYLHFANDVELVLKGNKLYANSVLFEFSSAKIELKKCYYSKEYNKKIESICAEIKFEKELIMEIKL